MARAVTSGAVDAAASGVVQPALKSAQDQRHTKDPPDTPGNCRFYAGRPHGVIATP
jgi:hypothetical protein